MSKRLAPKPKLTPEKPKVAIRKLEKNGFELHKQNGGDWWYTKVKDGKRLLVPMSVHPKDLGVPFVKLIIRRSKKTNEEWVNL